jgi:DNA-directed RNA polymerase specialized sigma24 family protein
MVSHAINENDLRSLQQMLLRANPGVMIPSRDREDVVQETLLRLVKERPPSSDIPLQARARTALRHAAIDYVRRESRRPPLGQAPPETSAAASPQTDDLVSFVLRVHSRVCEVASSDVADYVVLKYLGYTEGQIAEHTGWSTQRAGAARKQLGRLKPAVIQAIRSATQ